MQPTTNRLSEYNTHIKELENAITRNTDAGRGRGTGNPQQRASDLARLREQIQGLYKQQESAFQQCERDARELAAKRGVKLSPARSDAAGNERAEGQTKMKVADIEAVLKRTGGRLLKDSDPELFKRELEGGPSIQFSSRTSQPSEQKGSDLPGDDAGESRDIADNH